jgi:3-oxoacyl-[acyl-carrier protein] reductase
MLFVMTSMEQIKNIFEINFFSQIFLTQLVGRIMSRRRGGRIVFISSMSGIDGIDQLEYSSGKAAIICATKKLAMEFDSFGVLVNAVAPGMTKTDMIKIATPEIIEDRIKRTALKRFAEPREIAGAVLFFASDLAASVTGQILRVDGGFNKYEM